MCLCVQILVLKAGDIIFVSSYTYGSAPENSASIDKGLQALACFAFVCLLCFVT